MGLYDRDYMREPPADETEEQSTLNRLLSRRRRLLWIGLVLLVAAIITILATT